MKEFSSSGRIGNLHCFNNALVSLCATTILLLSAIASQAQKANANSFILKGRITGARDGEAVFVYDLDKQSNLDTAIIENELFTMSGTVDHPVTCWIRYRDEYAILQVENTTISFDAPSSNMHLYAKATGGPEQQLRNELTALQQPFDHLFYSAYDSLQRRLYAGEEDRKRLTTTFNTNQDKAQDIYVAFGVAHPDTYLGLDILYRNRDRLGRDSIASLLTKMSGSIIAFSKAQSLAIFAYGRLVEKGKPIIDFEARTLDGNTFRLSSLKGRYILLNFWNAACAPCRRENRKMSRDGKGLAERLAIVSFSTDQNKASWKAASVTDRIFWTNVSDLQGESGRIKTQYAVQAIPTSYLINPAGIVVEKFVGLSDDFLEQIKAYLNTVQ